MGVGEAIGYGYKCIETGCMAGKDRGANVGEDTRLAGADEDTGGGDGSGSATSKQHVPFSR